MSYISRSGGGPVATSGGGYSQRNQSQNQGSARYSSNIQQMQMELQRKLRLQQLQRQQQQKQVYNQGGQQMDSGSDYQKTPDNPSKTTSQNQRRSKSPPPKDASKDQKSSSKAPNLNIANSLGGKIQDLRDRLNDRRSISTSQRTTEQTQQPHTEKVPSGRQPESTEKVPDDTRTEIQTNQAISNPPRGGSYGQRQGDAVYNQDRRIGQPETSVPDSSGHVKTEVEMPHKAVKTEPPSPYPRSNFSRPPPPPQYSGRLDSRIGISSGGQGNASYDDKYYSSAMSVDADAKGGSWSLGNSYGGGRKYQGKGLPMTRMINKQGKPYYIPDKIKEKLSSEFTEPVVDLPALNNEEVKFNQFGRLFIGNLPRDTPEKTVKELFSPYGEIGSVFLNKDYSYGFIVFDFRYNASKAMRELQGHNMKGRPLKIRYATVSSGIKIRYTTPFTSNELLAKAFLAFGQVEKARALVDDRQNPKGEGYVIFADKKAAVIAVKKCAEECFFLNAVKRPVLVEPLISPKDDDEEGLPEANLPRTDAYYKERKMAPHFGEPGTFEHDFGMRWKQLYDIYEEKKAALDSDMAAEMDKLDAKMLLAEHDYETEQLRKELVAREAEAAHLRGLTGQYSSTPSGAYESSYDSHYMYDSYGQGYSQSQYDTYGRGGDQVAYDRYYSQERPPVGADQAQPRGGDTGLETGGAYKRPTEAGEMTVEQSYEIEGHYERNYDAAPEAPPYDGIKRPRY